MSAGGPVDGRTEDDGRISDPHRVVISFDLDGDELGTRTHGHVARQLESMVLWALHKHGYRLGGVIGLKASVDDAD